MFHFKHIAAVFSGLTSALLIGLPALATPSATMPVGGITSQPIGHYEFCQTHQAECSVRSSDTTPADLTAYGWKTVQKINAEVNADVAPMTDQELYGRDEVWAYPTRGAGDCEDYVLEKRKLLIKSGVPVSDLLITVVRKPNGEGHAVLTLRTNAGDYVLDNLSDTISLWYATPYTYLKRQAAFDSGRWVAIEQPSTDLPVAALK